MDPTVISVPVLVGIGGLAAAATESIGDMFPRLPLDGTRYRRH
jgi:hypothetical protein